MARCPWKINGERGRGINVCVYGGGGGGGGQRKREELDGGG